MNKLEEMDEDTVLFLERVQDFTLKVDGEIRSYARKSSKRYGDSEGGEEVTIQQNDTGGQKNKNSGKIFSNLKQFSVL